MPATESIALHSQGRNAMVVECKGKNLNVAINGFGRIGELGPHVQQIRVKNNCILPWAVRAVCAPVLYAMSTGEQPGWISSWGV